MPLQAFGLGTRMVRVKGRFEWAASAFRPVVNCYFDLWLTWYWQLRGRRRFVTSAEVGLIHRDETQTSDQ